MNKIPHNKIVQDNSFSEIGFADVGDNFIRNVPMSDIKALST